MIALTAAEIAAAAGVVVANDNAPAQQVLSGKRAQLRQAAATASMEGIRSMELPVSAAFHSPAMAGAVDRFREALALACPGVTFSAGMALVTADRPVTDVLEAADRAMYRAKDAGGDQVVVAPRLIPA